MMPWITRIAAALRAAQASSARTTSTKNRISSSSASIDQNAAAISSILYTAHPLTYQGKIVPAGSPYQVACANVYRDGSVAGYFCLYTDPRATLFPLLQANRTGNTGETYFIGESGQNSLAPSFYSIAGDCGKRGAFCARAAISNQGQERNPGPVDPGGQPAFCKTGDASTGYLENYQEITAACASSAAGQWLAESDIPA